MVFHWSLGDSKSPQISRTLLSILADLNNAIVWMVFTCPLISKSSSLWINPFVTVLNALITIVSPSLSCSTVFFQFFSKVKIFISLFTFFQFYTVVGRNDKVHYTAGSLLSFFFFFFFFLLTLTGSGRLAEIRWSICISKSQWTLCVSFSRTDSKLCIYHLFVWSNINLEHNSQWISFPA